MIIWRGWGALPIVIAALCIGLGGLMSTLNKGLFGVFAGLALIVVVFASTGGLTTAEVGIAGGTSLLARRARQWSTHHKLPCLTAVADGSGAGLGLSIVSRICRRSGWTVTAGKAPEGGAAFTVTMTKAVDARRADRL